MADQMSDNVISRQADTDEACAYCGAMARVFFSYNPEANLDICPDCFAATETATYEVRDLADGTLRDGGILPDGSGFAVVSFPLPENHWSQVGPDELNVPPMGLRLGTDDPGHEQIADIIRAAARYGYRCATMNGKDHDLDPDALVQNIVVGLLGYWTADGLSSDAWANPNRVPPRVSIDLNDR